MTLPVVTEIAVRLLAVEYDDFIDQFEVPPPAPSDLPLERPLGTPSLATAA